MKSIIYNNLKPSKVLTSLDFETNNLFLTDYKYAKSVKDQIKKKSENDISKKKHLLNKFSSLNSHLGICKKIYYIISKKILNESCDNER